MTIPPHIQQLSIAAGTLLISFSAGASMGFPTALLYQLKKTGEFPTDLNTTSWMGSIHGLAGIAGAIGPFVMQWKGRKLSFIAACLILIIGWVLVYAAKSVSIILLSETIIGFGASVQMTVCYDILTEMITPKYRNIAVQSYCAFHSLGLVMPGAMVSLLHWRLIGIMMCLPAVLGLLISITWLESPLWLAYKNNIEKCKTNFTKLRGTDEYSIKELQEVIVAHTERLNKNNALTNETCIIRLWRQVSRKDFIKPALHVLLLFNHMYWSGFAVVLIYSSELILNATQNEKAEFIGAIVINFLFVISSGLSNIFVRLFKMKTVLLFGTCGSAVCLLCASIVTFHQSAGYFSKESFLCLYFLIGYMIATSLGQVPVELTMTAELVPVKHRGLGGALFIICACILSSSSLKISPYLFVYLGLGGTFLIYTLNCIVCGLLIWKFVPETKGRTLQQIENYYTHGTFEIKLRSDEEIIPLQHFIS